MKEQAASGPLRGSAGAADGRGGHLLESSSRPLYGGVHARASHITSFETEQRAAIVLAGREAQPNDWASQGEEP
jgi:hypothetical protein